MAVNDTSEKVGIAPRLLLAIVPLVACLAGGDEMYGSGGSTGGEQVTTTGTTNGTTTGTTTGTTNGTTTGTTMGGESSTDAATGAGSTGASAAETTGGGASETGTESSGGPPAAAVPVFLAQGHLGRTTISCDDGLTWIRDTSQDDAARCFEDGLDCDHSPFAGRGIAFGSGTFVLTWGWGPPGGVVRTEDAAQFEQVLSETTFADVAFGNGRFVANGKTPQISDDLGETWGPGGALGIDVNTRSIEFFPHDGGVFVVTGESGDQRVIVRSEDGVEWAPASVRPPECGQNVVGAAYGGGTAILASKLGHVCRSSDGGDTWEHTAVSDGFTSPPVWTGAEFFVYEGDTLHRSADGASWQSEPISLQGASIGPLARSEAGTFVAVNAGWMKWYEQQQFYRSTDGVTWEALPPGAFTGGHPIRFIAHGAVAPGMGCPAN